MFNYGIFSFKNVFSIFLVFLLFLTVTSVCASDVDDSDVIVDSDFGNAGSIDNICVDSDIENGIDVVDDFNEENDIDYPDLNQSSDIETDSESSCDSDYDEFSPRGGSKISTKIVASSFTKHYLNGTNLVAYLKTISGTPLAGKNVVINFSGTLYNRTTDSNGEFNLTIRAHPKEYTTKLNFSGDSTYALCNKTIKITVIKAITHVIAPSCVIKYYMNDTNLTTYLIDDYGNYLPNKTIKINLDGQDYYMNTDTDGKVVLNLNMTKGNYVASIYFDGDNDYFAHYYPTHIYVFMHNTFFANVSKDIHSQGKFYFRLLSDGLAFSNQSVILSINGKNYTTLTDEEGVGSFNLNLSQGLWKVKLTYNGHDDYDSCSGEGWINVSCNCINYTLDEIINSAISLKDYVNNNLSLPSQWQISENNVSIFEFSYLMAKTITNIDNDINSSIILPYIYKGCEYEDIISKAQLSHFSYMDLINNIALFAEMNSYMPNTASLSDWGIDFKTYTYSFAKILAFYNLTGVLPGKIDFNTDVNSSLNWVYSPNDIFYLNEDDFKPGLNEYYDGSNISSYLLNEDSNPNIISFANILTNNSDSIYDKVEILFSYVRDCISYSYYTESRGADYALSNGFGNWFDQDRLLAALCRAIDIPVRLNEGENIVFKSGLVTTHSWVQILMEDIWYVADPTGAENYLGIINRWTAINMTSLSQGNSFLNMSSVDIEGIQYNGFSNGSVSYVFIDDYQFNDTVVDYGIGPCNFVQTDIFPMKSLTSLISTDCVFDYGSASGNVLLMDEYGTPLANKNILFTIGDYSCNVTTDLWGFAYYNLNMEPGNYTLFYRFLEDENYLRSQGNSSICINKASSNISITNANLSLGDSLSFVVSDYNNKPIFNQSLYISIGDNVYNLITNLEGLVILNDVFDAGSYSGHCILNESDMYDSCEYNFSFAVSPCFKFDGEKEYLIHSGSKDIDVSLVYRNIHLDGVDVNCKIINSNMETVKEYVLNSGDSGIISIPSSDLDPGYYVVSYYCNPLNGAKPFWGQCDLYIVSDDVNIKSKFDIVENHIHQKGEYFVGRLFDDFGHPIANANVSIYIPAISKTYYKLTDNDGYFRLAINLNCNNYTVLVGYSGDDDYRSSNRLSTIFATHTPNVAYTINMTLRTNIRIGNNNYYVPFGREIGIYKNGNLYKFTYDYNISGATRLNHNVYYFFSFDDNKSAVTVNINDPIRHSGFLLYSDGYNVLLKFLGYTYGDLDSFTALFNGKRYGGKQISRVYFLRNNQTVASFYFSSEIITSVTNSYASSHNLNARDYIYRPVYTEFRLVDSVKGLFNPRFNVYSSSIENLYYGDNRFNGDLNNSHWSSNIGFEAIETYLLNKGGRISDESMSDYVGDYDNFSSNNTSKVAYESFLTALSYQWLNDKLADEVCEKYDSTWYKYSYYLIGSFVNINGRLIDVQSNPWFYSLNGYASQLAKTEYSLKSSLLEQYVIGLNGLNSTCAVSEILKGLLNGSEFNCYHDNVSGSTFLGFSDNSSYLEFNIWGYANSIIFPSMYDGGMSLGNFSFNSESPLQGNLNNILQLVNNLSIDNPVLSRIINPMIGGIVGSIENMNFAQVMTFLTDTKLLAGIAGGIIMEIGLVSTFTGVGASWGVPLLVLGTALNAYSCGMFDDLGTDHPGYSDPVNQFSFVTSMALCGFGGGAEAAAGRASLNAMSSVERNRIIHTSVDVVETCFNGCMAKTKIYGYSNEPVKFILDTTLQSQSTKGKIRQLSINSIKSAFSSVCWDICRYLNDEGYVIYA